MAKETADSWKIHTHAVELRTQGQDQVLDITHAVQALVQKSGVQEGQALVFVPGATASVTTLEYEPGLLKDLPALLEELISSRRDWEHNRTWGDGNGGSHLRAALLGPSLTVPVAEGALMLGTWQQIVFIDHDTRGRKRRVVVQVTGRG
ncbi:YjbQ family protein [candidate division FCPU426 bacterium]|nr:YjbQ family protein [candidate division FCPU426 bacterium]